MKRGRKKLFSLLNCFPLEFTGQFKYALGIARLWSLAGKDLEITQMRIWNERHTDGLHQFVCTLKDFLAGTPYETVAEAEREVRHAEAEGPNAGNVGVNYSVRSDGRTVLVRYTW